MASGTINLTTGTSSFKARLVWSSVASQTYNTSTVSFSYQVSYYSSDPYTTGNIGKYNGYCRWSYDGETAQDEHFFMDVSANVPNGGWATISSWQWTIPHTSSGTRSIGIWGAIGNEKFFTGDNTFFSQWITLDYIPKGASLTSAPDFTDDDEQITIKYSNPAGTKASKIELYIYDGDGTNTVLVGPYSINRNATNATITLTNTERERIRQRTLEKGVSELIVRYYLKTTIGSIVYPSNQIAKMCYIKNPEPELHYSWWDADTGVTALTNNNEVFIKGYSNLDFSLDATPQKGASITQYAVTWVYTKSSTVPMIGGSGTHDPFWNITTDKVKFSATDNRGVTKTEEQLLYMVDYFPPTCAWELMELEPDKEWVEDNDLPAGDVNNYIKAKVEISGKFFNDKFGPNGVDNQLKLEIKHPLIDDWSEVHELLIGDGITGNDYKVSFYIRGFYYTDAVTVQFRVSDKLVTTPVETEEKTLKYLPIFDWSDTDFNFNVPVSFEGEKMEDMVVKTGTSSMGSNGTWYWRKWKSGKAECYGVRNFGNMAVSTAWGALYQSDYFSQSLPSSLFIETPSYIGIDFYSNDSSSYGWIARGGSKPTKTNTGQFIVLRATSATLSAGTMCFHCIGKWK